ncbi:sucrase ferredoxin [Nocardia sp. alder85J]|uniref:sucrase ferredoxin n=1 Tax=Nocardia sp. alder85J TaxID=2862949 RepID=UPI001CD1A3AB|nr:sucrase ferredoxin [Nocardia sp. alder85J]MCX4097208.1 sucrase ferredoxin [Nocardia sp. alder85J]
MMFTGLSCSAAAAIDIPLPGSATRVSGWLCVEQPGAWGRDVIGDEVLGPELTPELAARTKAAQVRPTLIRRPGRSEFTGVRTILLVSSRPGESWCERLEITELKQLLDLDLHLLTGPAPGLGAPVADSPILVCTHGKRDQCCALLGRPIAARLATEYPDRVWECSHTGGHRFAPAMVLLPTGLTFGRLDEDAAVAVVAAADRGELPLTGFRGRSGCSPVEQVAEIAVRERVPVLANDLAVSAVPDAEPTGDPATFAGAALVAHRDGRRWLVTAHTVSYAPRQASCGAAPKSATAVVADGIRELR